jgi:hypothetical protein
MKANRDGRECPPWCVRDHEDEDEPWSCASADREVTWKPRNQVLPGGEAGARVRLSPWDKTPEVITWSWGSDIRADTGHICAQSKADVEETALFLERAAEMPKPQLRALAKKVREAAAEAWPEAEAG